ncbi:MAG: hypothetical protein FWD33_02600 [Alphaproteobacteria bacterium]|nr:hypothetical protein [Alphaproteobacteria bacterium]
MTMVAVENRKVRWDDGLVPDDALRGQARTDAINNALMGMGDVEFAEWLANAKNVLREDPSAALAYSIISPIVSDREKRQAEQSVSEEQSKPVPVTSVIEKKGRRVYKNDAERIEARRRRQLGKNLGREFSEGEFAQYVKKCDELQISRKATKESNREMLRILFVYLGMSCQSGAFDKAAVHALMNEWYSETRVTADLVGGGVKSTSLFNKLIKKGRILERHRDKVTEVALAALVRNDSPEAVWEAMMTVLSKERVRGVNRYINSVPKTDEKDEMLDLVTSHNIFAGNVVSVARQAARQAA